MLHCKKRETIVRYNSKEIIMLKYTRKLCIFGVFLFVLFSCSSSPNASYSKASADYEDSGVSNRAAKETDDSRMVTYSVSLRLSVKNTDETRKILVEQVNSNNGFIVRESDDYITSRIPVAHMEAFLTNARTLGKIDNATKTGTDITDQYRDNVVRLDNLKNVRNKYLALLEKANAVSDILSIERELERVNTEIEILEGRIKYAELSVAYSNITVTFRERAKPGPLGWIFYGLYRGLKWLIVWN
jgi:hypothetical protein